jgi:hypothetical protein
MVRLRNALIVFALATGLAGCSSPHQWSIANLSIWHCDTCDDFPAPAYGSNFSMMPGTYTGPPAPGTNSAGQPAAGAPAAAPAPAGAVAPPMGGMPGMAPAATATTPPTPPSP